MREAFGADFDLDPGYLDTPSHGVPPRFAADAVRRDVERWAVGHVSTGRYDDAVRRARQGFAALTGFSDDAVAIGSGVSPLVGLVATAIPDGSRVVTVRDEFTSVTFPFAAQAGRGVTVTEVGLDELAHRAPDFDVVAVSVVRSSDGAVVDLAALREATHGTPTLVVLDVTQALGWADVDLSWADAVVGAGYKWLLAPRGAAWLALGDEAAARITPHAANWYATEDRAHGVFGLPLRLAGGARRLDTSPVWWSHLGASLTLPWLASLDRAAVQRHCVGLADELRGRLGLPALHSAIVTVRRPGAAPRLAEAGVAARVRDGVVRVGFHLYNDEGDVDLVAEALEG